jgi:hypothetical protein
LYSPDTCCFINARTNYFITKSKHKGKLLGAYLEKSNGKFKSSTTDPFTGKSLNLGRFKIKEDAQRACLTKKIEFASRLADTETDPRAINAIINLYNERMLE